MVQSQTIKQKTLQERVESGALKIDMWYRIIDYIIEDIQQLTQYAENRDSHVKMVLDNILPLLCSFSDEANTLQDDLYNVSMEMDKD